MIITEHTFDINEDDNITKLKTKVGGNKAVPASSLDPGIYIGIRTGKHPLLKHTGSQHYGIIDIGSTVFKGSSPLILHVAPYNPVLIKNPLGMEAAIRLQELPRDEVWTIIGRVNNPQSVKQQMIDAVNNPYKYHVLFNNCEHFVNKTLRGKRYSMETLKAYGKGGLMIAAGLGILKYLKGSNSDNK